MLDGRPLSPDEISRMADLESREVLLAKLAGAMQASLQNAAYLFNAPLAQAARAFGALQTKQEQQAGAAAPDRQPEADAQPDTGAQPETDPQPEAGSEPEAVPEPEAGSEPEAAPTA